MKFTSPLSLSRSEKNVIEPKNIYNHKSANDWASKSVSDSENGYRCRPLQQKKTPTSASTVHAICTAKVCKMHSMEENVHGNKNQTLKPIKRRDFVIPQWCDTCLDVVWSACAECSGSLISILLTPVRELRWGIETVRGGWTGGLYHTDRL